MHESNGIRFLSFKVYEEWKGRAVSSKKAWRLKDVIVYPIEVVEDRNLTALSHKGISHPLGNFQE